MDFLPRRGPSRNHRHPAGQRFGNDKAKVFGLAGQDKKPCPTVKLPLLVIGHLAHKLEPVRQSLVSASPLYFRAVTIFVPTGNDQAPANWPDSRPGLDKIEQALFGMDAGQEQDNGTTGPRDYRTMFRGPLVLWSRSLVVP